MSATLYYQPVDHRAVPGATSSTRSKLSEVFERDFPMILSQDDIPGLRVLSIAAENREPYEELMDAVELDGSIRLWLEN